jgi:general secretion pathway protein A
MNELRSVFGFHSTPFTRELRDEDQIRFAFLEEAMAPVVHAIEGRMCAAVLGPAGTGKTALLRRVRALLPSARYRIHYVKVTDLSKRDMCRELATAVGIPPAGSYPQLVRKLQERFEGTVTTDGLRPVLLLDECHELRPDVLAMLRILTNFEMDSRLVVAIVLCGQPPLKKLLSRDDQEAISKRISHYAQLRLLSREETETYLGHRCLIAGVQVLPFDSHARDALFELGRGNLRATDTLALKSLQYDALAGQSTVSSAHVLAARKDLP